MTLVNKTTLQELIAAVEYEAVCEIAAALKTTLQTFREELPSMDAEQMGRRAHMLKGSTSYLGTEALYAAAVAADTAHKDGGDVAAALKQLDSLIDPSLAAIDSALQLYH